MSSCNEIAEKLRQGPYHPLPFRSNCIGKAFRFKKQCKQMGIGARVVICAGITRAKPMVFWMKMLTIHAWGEVNGERIEVAMPLGKVGIWGIVDINIKPVIAIWI